MPAGTLVGHLLLFALCIAMFAGCGQAAAPPANGDATAPNQADAAAATKATAPDGRSGDASSTAPAPSTASPSSGASSAEQPAGAASPGAAPPAEGQSSAAQGQRASASSARADDLTPPDDVEQSLAQHAQLVRDAFARYEEIEKLIYPFGWVRRRLAPEAVDHEALPREGNDQPQRGIVRIQLQQLCSVIHPTRQAAADDDDLLPFAPQASREEMRESPLNPKLEPLELEIAYEYRNGHWQRTGWKLLRPKLSRSADWLDRIGIP